jgi:hypothetical protein
MPAVRLLVASPTSSLTPVASAAASRSNITRADGSSQHTWRPTSGTDARCGWFRARRCSTGGTPSRRWGYHTAIHMGEDVELIWRLRRLARRRGGRVAIIEDERGPRRPGDGDGWRPLLCAAGGDGLRRGAPRAPGASDPDGRRRPPRRRQGPPRRHPSVHGRHSGVPPGRRCQHQLGDDRRPSGPDVQPRREMGCGS